MSLLDQVFEQSGEYHRRTKRVLEVQWQCQNMHPTSYTIFIHKGALNDKNLHPALLVFHEWQKDYKKGWKWNNLHRHLNETERVDWDDNRSFELVPPMNYLTFLSRKERIDMAFGMSIRNWFTAPNNARVSYWKLKRCLSRIVKGFKTRRRLKRRWWKSWVTWGDPSFSLNGSYWAYMEKTSWREICVEVGYTFKYQRREGYIPFVKEAIFLRKEAATLEKIVNRRFAEERDKEFERTKERESV